jgi:nitrate/TMAO reductase-like tetraheme cytochrome c subunit
MPIFQRNFRNWISWAGMVLAASALFAFFFLFAIDQFAGRHNPYLGILAYLVTRAFFLGGIVLTVFGAFIQWRRQRHALRVATPLALKIDLSRPRDRRILAIFATFSVGFLFVTAVGSYETYHYTESAQFCGQTCHLPMEPEAIASQQTAHARVECAACHVGPGAAAYFKTKLNGVNNFITRFRNDYDRPIHVTEANPRPAQAICEQCHWPNNTSAPARTPTNIISPTKRTLRLRFVSSKCMAAVTRPMVRKAVFIGT